MIDKCHGSSNERWLEEIENTSRYYFICLLILDKNVIPEDKQTNSKSIKPLKKKNNNEPENLKKKAKKDKNPQSDSQDQSNCQKYDSQVSEGTSNEYVLRDRENDLLSNQIISKQRNNNYNGVSTKNSNKSKKAYENQLSMQKSFDPFDMREKVQKANTNNDYIKQNEAYGYNSYYKDANS